MTVSFSQSTETAASQQDKNPNSLQTYRIGQATVGEAKYLIGSVSRLTMLDFWAGFGLIFIGIPTPFVTMPVGTVVVMLFVLYKLTKPATLETRYNSLFFSIILFAVGWALFESLAFNGISVDEAIRRAIRMAVVLLLALQIAQKRIDIRSLIFGVVAGLIFNLIGFYAGVAPDNYGGTLTGWLNDKNQAGLYYAIFGFLFVAMVRKTSHRIVALVVTSGMLWLTGSRTSLAAYAFAVLWLYFSHRLNLFGKAVLALLFYLAVNYLEDNFARAGAFADRLGSDLLRERIDETMYRMIDVVPWYGGGLGTAQVWLQNRYFYFHNSYMTLVQEAGWLYMIVIVALMISAAFIWKQPRAQRIVIAEAAMVIIIITSQRLGEVILTVPWAIVVGLALLYLNPDKDLDASDSGHHEPGAMQKAQSSDEKPELQNGQVIEKEAPASVTEQEAPKKSTTSKSFNVSSIRQRARKV